MYAGAALLVVLAFADLLWERSPINLLLVGGVAGAWFAAALMPVTLGTSGLWRARHTMTAPVVIAAAALMPPSWAVLSVAVAAVGSGCIIRRFRTTPGRMLMGASRSVFDGAAVVAVWGVLPTSSPLEVVAASWVCVVAMRWVDIPAWTSLFVVALGGPLRSVVTSQWRSVSFWAWRCTYVTLGSIAVLLYRAEPWTLALLVPPFGTALAAGSRNARLVRERERQRSILELMRRLHACASAVEVIDVAGAGASELFGAVVDVVAAPFTPDRREIAAPLEWGLEQRWLVARERYGPPLMEGRYGRDDRALLELIAAMTAAPAETAAITMELQRQALTDDLTGLSNRRAGRQSFGRCVEQAATMRAHFVTLFVDIDRFKQLNTEFGHDLADEVLRAVADRLRATARVTDTVARWGGEEFLVTLESESDAVRAAERFRIAAGGPVELSDGRVAEVTVSVGAAMFPLHGREADELLHATTLAMLSAKSEGRNRVAVAAVAADR